MWALIENLEHNPILPPKLPATSGCVGGLNRDPIMHRFQRYLNDPRIRSAAAGGLGGFAGWLAAELFVGRPGTLWLAAVAGLLCGMGIAATLAAAEGIIIQSWSLTRRALKIGTLLGAVGGMIGAGFGQVAYSVTAASGDPGTDRGTIFAPNFSAEVQKRVAGKGGETGEVEIALIWDNTNDLDLHVTDPDHEEIFFAHRRSRSGGWLDIDCNAGCGNLTRTPVEHVRWRRESAPDAPMRSQWCTMRSATIPTRPSIAWRSRTAASSRSYEGDITFIHQRSAESRVEVCQFRHDSRTRPPSAVQPPAAGPGFFRG